MPSTDFNGDGRDDIFWRNSQTGIVTNWLGQPDGGFISNERSTLRSSPVVASECAAAYATEVTAKVHSVQLESFALG